MVSHADELSLSAQAAVAILATSDPTLGEKLKAYRTVQAARVREDTLS